VCLSIRRLLLGPPEEWFGLVHQPLSSMHPKAESENGFEKVINFQRYYKYRQIGMIELPKIYSWFGLVQAAAANQNLDKV